MITDNRNKNPMSGTAEGEELVPRSRSSSSFVWKYFGFRVSNINQKQIICKESSRVVSAPQGNTTNLFNHLKTHHKIKYDECIKAKKKVAWVANMNCQTSTQTSIKASLYSASLYPFNSQRHTEITDAITIHLAKDMCPINTE